MEKINIAELLKGCPKGMELYSPIFGELKFNEVNAINNRILVVQQNGYIAEFESDGRLINCKNGECLLFPSKGKTTWEGFQRPFKDGDVVATTDGRWIGITTGGEKGQFIPTYCVIKNNGEFEVYLDKKERWQFHRLATTWEKEKLFDAIKNNGYNWNEETKTLEKLVEPKFKVGDRVVKKGDISTPVSIVRVGDKYYYHYSYTEGTIGLLPIAEQDEWELVSNIEPKFKVGDRVKKKDSNEDVVLITDIANNYYIVETKYGMETTISISIQNDYELVPNKFDISALKSFDKVLVRGGNGQKWTHDFFGFMDKDKGLPFVCVGYYISQCIPYEKNEHLLGTTDDCDEFYKNWKE